MILKAEALCNTILFIYCVVRVNISLLYSYLFPSAEWMRFIYFGLSEAFYDSIKRLGYYNYTLFYLVIKNQGNTFSFLSVHCFIAILGNNLVIMSNFIHLGYNIYLKISYAL